MPYGIFTTSAFEIGSVAPNADTRTFAKDVRGFSIDSAFLANASDLTFAKDSRFFVISGGVSTREVPYLQKTSAFQITGRIRGELISAHQQATFAIEGRPVVGVCSKRTDAFLIDIAPQETAP